MAPVVLGDGAAPVEGTGEGGFALHAAPAERGAEQRGRGLVSLSITHQEEWRERKRIGAAAARETLRYSTFILVCIKRRLVFL